MDVKPETLYPVSDGYPEVRREGAEPAPRSHLGIVVIHCFCYPISCFAWQFLDLSFNSLTEEAICDLGILPHLRVLLLTGNGLTSLPPNMAVKEQ